MSVEIILKELRKNRSSMAVLLIDMQSVFLKSLSNVEFNRLLNNQLQVIKLCKEIEIPLVIIKFEGQGRLTRKIRKSVYGFPKKAKTYLIKSQPNAFDEVALRNYLKSKHIDKLLLMGVRADQCVFETMRGALDWGYAVMTGDDVIAVWENTRIKYECLEEYFYRTYFIWA